MAPNYSNFTFHRMKSLHYIHILIAHCSINNLLIIVKPLLLLRVTHSSRRHASSHWCNRPL